jgi:Tfp pilus assembly pilus retraction ATPase PilT
MMYTVSEVGRGENYACPTAAMEGTFSAAPDVVYAPEMIARTAIHLALLSANAGVTTYSTLHTSGTSATIVRVLSPFDLEEREERAMALMDSLRLIVSCRLVPSRDGRECQLREFLPFSRTTREELLSVPYQQWPPLIQSLTQSRGQTFNQAAQIAEDRGLISPDVANQVMEGR